MAKRYLLVLVIAAIAVPASAQDARTVLQAASTAMGAANLKSTIQYSGTGWVAAVGQSYNAGLQNVGDGWPQFDATSYTRTIDYDARSLKDEITRVQGNHPRRGGGGTPLQGEQRSTTIVSGTYAWDLQGTSVNPAPGAVELRQLEILLSPHGFLRAAMAATDATAFSRRVLGVDDLVKNVTVVSFKAMGKYTINGMFNDQNLLEHVQTWIPNPVAGDMMYELRYTDYKDFNGVKFPTNIHGHTGAAGYDFTRGFWNVDPNSLQMNVKSVQPNVGVPAMAVPDNVRQATVQPVRAESQKLAEGVWLIGGGSHNSVAVEFRDYVAVVEAPQNEVRSLAVIGEIKRLIPNKPIEYVVATHHHFDHIGGLRAYFSDGATIVASLNNRDFLERVLLSPAPRTLEPDRLSLHPLPTTSTPTDKIETVTQKYVLSDGNRVLEIHALQAVNHAEYMLVAYLPAEKILINADLYSPPAAGAQPPAMPSQSMTTLRRNMRRLKLDVARHVPIHGRVGSNEEFLKIVGN